MGLLYDEVSSYILQSSRYIHAEFLTLELHTITGEAFESYVFMGHI